MVVSKKKFKKRLVNYKEGKGDKIHNMFIKLLKECKKNVKNFTKQ